MILQVTGMTRGITGILQPCYSHGLKALNGFKKTDLANGFNCSASSLSFAAVTRSSS